MANREHKLASWDGAQAKRYWDQVKSKFQVSKPQHRDMDSEGVS